MGKVGRLSMGGKANPTEVRVEVGARAGARAGARVSSCYR